MDDSKDLVVVLSTAPPGRAASIAKMLIEKHLAACVNIMPVRSHFRWENDIKDEEEELMVIKTRRVLAPELSAAISDVHPYDMPEVIVIQLTGGFLPYLGWVRDETSL